MKRQSLTLGIFALLALSTSVFAQSLCTTVGCVNPTDSINWGAQGLGTPPAVWSTPQEWVSGTNAGEVGVVGPTDFTLMQEGVTWGGNFTPGDYLIWNQDNNTFEGPGSAGTIGIVFDDLVATAGAQIMADYYGPFTATVCVNEGPECFTENGISNGNNDGSAIFIGVKDPTADIEFLTFAVNDINNNNDEAIGPVSFAYTSPEPGTLILLGTGLLFLVAWRRKFAL